VALPPLRRQSPRRPRKKLLRNRFRLITNSCSG
jgi:hypothetical protein